MKSPPRRVFPDDAETARVCGPECRYRMFFEEGAADAVLAFSAEGTLTDVNRAGCEQIGLPREEIIGRSVDAVFVFGDRAGVGRHLAGITKKGWRGEALLTTQTGLIPVEINARRFAYERRDMVLVVARDITENKIRITRLAHQAATDPLTALNNRRGFLLKARQEFSRFKRYGNEFAMLMLDLDHFKKVNDTYGHHTGDELLREFTRRMRAAFRSSDILGRIGGEEFCVLLLETSPEVSGETGRALAFETAERLRRQVEHSPLRKEDVVIPYTVSIGLTMACASDAALEDILRRADAALYRAKNGGRNRVEAEYAGENAGGTGDRGTGGTVDADLEKELRRVDTTLCRVRRRIRRERGRGGGVPVP
jgi:diguanylate cyclase (GGDEF)-like protein/PAS domain S-box-containing protein